MAERCLLPANDNRPNGLLAWFEDEMPTASVTLDVLRERCRLANLASLSALTAPVGAQDMLVRAAALAHLRLEAFDRGVAQERDHA